MGNILLLGLDEERWSSRQCFAPGACLMIASLPRRFVWVLIPLSSVAAFFEKRREFCLREFVFIHPSITLGQAITSEKLNQDDVITLLVRVRSDPLFVGKTLVDRFSVKIGDFALAIAKGREHSGA